MTKEKMWEQICKQNSKFLNQTPGVEVTLTTNGLKKLFDQAYGQGYKQGVQDEHKEKSTFEKIFGNQNL